MSNPTISVVLPTRNRASTLSRAVDSVLRQTFTAFEVIVVDDASEDETREVITGYKDRRLRSIFLDHRGGAPAARNAGIAAARASWIAFQDSDDEWLPEKLAIQSSLVATLDLGWAGAFSPLVRHSAGSPELVAPPLDVRDGVLLPALLRQNFVSTQTLLLRKRALDAIGGFDPALPRLQDWDVALSIAARFKLAHTAAPLVHVYESADSISKDRDAYFIALERILQKHMALFRTKPSIYAQLWGDLLRHSIRTRDGAKAGRLIAQGMRYVRSRLPG
jgi:glycosyltransferase involved in cell wall biosynthesis